MASKMNVSKYPSGLWHRNIVSFKNYVFQRIVLRSAYFPPFLIIALDSRSFFLDGFPLPLRGFPVVCCLQFAAEDD